MRLLRFGLPILALGTALASVSTAADADSLYGLHFFGDKTDTLPNTLLDLPGESAWDLEVALTDGDFWWTAGYQRPLYQELVDNRNMTMVTRIDYNWDNTVPHSSQMTAGAWASRVVSTTVNVLANECHIWVIGNEPNIVTAEGSPWPGRMVPPADYAYIYAAVRQAIHTTATASPLGEHRVLLGPVSPGGVIAGVRWMDGNEYLQKVMEELNPELIDGYALHSYGGSVTDFHNGYAEQMGVIFARAANAPCYITEWNRYAAPGMPEEEAAAAQFCRDAFADLNSWNASSDNDVVGTMWFVYDNTPYWAGYALEHWYEDGYDPPDPRDLFTAYQETVDLRYPAGQTPTGPPRQNDAGTKDDAGDSIGEATPVAASDYMAWCGSTDLNDFYGVELALGREITATVTPMSGRDIDLYLYDPSGNEEDVSSTGGSAAETVSFVADEAGTWAVRARRISGQGYYDLSITVTSPGEENLSLSAPTYLESGHNDDNQRGMQAIDDDPATKWCSFPLGISTPQTHTLALDLGCEALVSHFVVKHASIGGEPTYYNTVAFYVERGDSLQGPWTSLGYVDNSSQAAVSEVELSPAQTMEYVRLRVTQPNNGADWAVRIPEVEVWGVPGDPLPIVFQAEDYDSGLSAQNGYDYYDTTVGNSGGQYRSDDVDIETCSDGGYDVTNTASYEWLSYPFRSSGYYYDISVRYAAAGSGAKAHINVDYSNVTGTLILAATGGAQTWATRECGRDEISAGWKELRLYTDQPGASFDRFTLRPFVTETVATTTPFPVGWNMVSVPLDPVDPLVPYVWDQVEGAGNNLVNSFMRYIGYYELYPLYLNSVALGEGYWMLLTVASGETVEGAVAASPFGVALLDGWNLIGHPQKDPVALSTCEITDGATTLSLSEADTAGWVQALMYYFDGSAYVLTAPSGGEDDSLRPWRAYWLLANQAGLTLIVP